MAIVVNTNVASLNAQRNLTGSGRLLNTSLQRLSSGLRINSAKDDAAGLAISDRMNAQVRGMNQAVRNANDGISLAQTAEGAMAEMTNISQRMRELAVQSRNATNTAEDRASLDAEFQQLNSELDRIAQTTAFNGRKVLDGSLGTSVFQVGANVGETISVDVSTSMRTNAIGSFATVSYQLTEVADSTVAEGTAYKLDTAGDLVINGVNIAAATDSGNGVSQSSAKAIATAINLSTDTHGVTATAGTTSVTYTAATLANASSTDAGTTTDNLSYNLTINGTSVFDENEAGGIGAKTADQLAAAINGVKETTGVSASVNDAGDLTLTAADGRNIELKETAAGSTAADADSVTGYFGNTVDLTGVATAFNLDVEKAEITLSSNRAISINELATTTILDTVTNVVATTNTSTIDSANILTEANADTAIQKLDKVLSQIDVFRGDLGAVQNRFESTIANLMNSAENIAAAKSRIVDADFASETANLTKAQILQQAGLAMLSQANQVPQAALTLLQG